MKHFIIFFFLLLSINTSAQNFKGKITDRDGAPLYGSTIYIKEVSRGLVCNDDGHYQTKLPAGTYQVEYKCLGFRPIEKKIRITDSEITTINIILEENPFNLKEVIISNQEDPAYPIMRKAIQKAPLYAGAVKEYTAESYIKTNAELLKVSSLIDGLAKKGEGVKLSDFKNKVFTQESFNVIHYTAPNRYRQEVKAFSSSIPDNLDSKDAMGIMNSSLYNPKFGSSISPLNPDAFSYYKFRYEGFSEEGGMTINKIKVTPKLKDPMLIEGYIYIVDNSWHLYSAEITKNDYGAKLSYTVTYQNLEKEVYLPITYLTTVNFDLLGMKANMSNYASLTYTNIIANDKIVKELSEKRKPKKREFEIKRDTLYKVISDTLATKRDSLYWANVRTIPLGDREVKTFEKKDSVQHRLDSVRKEHKDPQFTPFDIISGGKIGSDSSKVVFKFDGLLQGVPEYNFVDGLWLGQKFNIDSKIGKHNKLNISPYIYYALSRKRILAGVDINLRYAPMQLGEFKVSVNSTSEDFNTEGIPRFVNAVSSLIWGKNYNFFYQKDNVSIMNNIDIANGLSVLTGFEIAKRNGLSNHTDYTWGRKRWVSENPYANDRFDKTAYYIGLTYTPYAYYRIDNAAKKYVRFASPTFYVRYNEALGGWQTNNARYRKLRGGVYQDNVKIGEFNKFNYRIDGGGFLGNKDRIHFADFQHFNTSDVIVSIKSAFSSFMLLNNYEASTNKYWFYGSFDYDSKYILLKRLPFLQGKMFTETLHLKALYTPDMKPYTEVGYGINLNGLNLIGINTGIFASFKKAKYESFGIRFSIDMDRNKGIFK